MENSGTILSGHSSRIALSALDHAVATGFCGTARNVEAMALSVHLHTGHRRPPQRSGCRLDLDLAIRTLSFGPLHT